MEAKAFLDPIAKYKYSGDGAEAFETLKTACITAAFSLAELKNSADTLEQLKAWEARLSEAQDEFLKNCPLSTWKVALVTNYGGRSIRPVRRAICKYLCTGKYKIVC